MNHRCLTEDTLHVLCSDVIDKAVLISNCNPLWREVSPKQTTYFQKLLAKMVYIPIIPALRRLR
jgi:hypothetical protein